MTPIIRLHKHDKILTFSRQKYDFNLIFMSCDKNNLNIHAPVLLNLLNKLRKRDKLLGKPSILALFSTHLINSINHDHSYKILYVANNDCVCVSYNSNKCHD